MSKKEKGASYHMGLGITSVLLILVVLSMTTLSVLSLLSAKNDLVLSKRRAEHVLEKAQAHSLYETALYELNEAALAGKALRSVAIDGVNIAPLSENSVAINVPFFGTLAIDAIVQFDSNGTETSHYIIQNTSDWEPDNSFELIDW